VQELRDKVLSGEMRLSIALGKALPDLRGRVNDERLVWLVNELQGYPNALEYYQRPAGYPPYRVVTGEMKLIDREGNYGECRHPLASRGQFFISAPLSWLEEAAEMQGSVSVVEMQELSGSFVKSGGGVVCVCTKDQIKRILNSFTQSFVALINEMCASKPKT
jgi:hypothetical protein